MDARKGPRPQSYLRMSRPPTTPEEPKLRDRRLAAKVGRGRSVSSRLVRHVSTSHLVADMLEYSCCNIDDTMCSGIGAEITTHAGRLSGVRLGGNKISAAGLRKLCRPLAASSMRELWLGDNPIGDMGAKVLAKLLPDLPTLEELWLCGTDLSCEGAKQLATGLLEAAVLQLPPPPPTNAADSGEAVPSNPRSPDAGGVASTPPLNPPSSAHANHGLRWLLLHNNMIADEGASALAEAIVLMPLLSLISLRGNNIGDAGASALAVVLQALPPP